MNLHQIKTIAEQLRDGKPRKSDKTAREAWQFLVDNFIETIPDLNPMIAVKKIVEIIDSGVEFDVTTAEEFTDLVKKGNMVIPADVWDKIMETGEMFGIHYTEKSTEVKGFLTYGQKFSGEMEWNGLTLRCVGWALPTPRVVVYIPKEAGKE